MKPQNQDIIFEEIHPSNIRLTAIAKILNLNSPKTTGFLCNSSTRLIYNA